MQLQMRKMRRHKISQVYLMPKRLQTIINHHSIVGPQILHWMALMLLAILATLMALVLILIKTSTVKIQKLQLLLLLKVILMPMSTQPLLVDETVIVQAVHLHKE